MTKIELIRTSNHAISNPQKVSQLLVILVILQVLNSSSLYNSNAFAQGLSPESGNDLVPALPPAPRSIVSTGSDLGAYDQRQVESLEDLARTRLSDGEYQQALLLFKQALHVARVNQGLYHEAQIPIIDDIITAGIALKNWEEVDNYYSYQEHLYRRLYAIDDPRLEVGLQKVSAWHITALNVNLDGKRIEHLRKANQLFKLRREVAQNTLALNDPKFAMLSRNIEHIERELFLSSDLNREMLVRQKDNQTRRNSLRQSERTFSATRD